jgi:hypothetical protein
MLLPLSCPALSYLTSAANSKPNPADPLSNPSPTPDIVPPEAPPEPLPNAPAAALSTAEGLLLQPRGEGELNELSDDAAVAAAVMLPMVAAESSKTIFEARRGDLSAAKINRWN